MILNLSALGVSEQALTDAILSQLGMTKEQAVKALAEKLGVKFGSDASAVKTGDTVQTAQGAAKALVIDEADRAALARVGGLFAQLA